MPRWRKRCASSRPAARAKAFRQLLFFNLHHCASMADLIV
jgi:hypothetical protein